MYLITGGAGFIGSNVAAALDDSGADIVIGDRLGSSDIKWRNIAKRRVRDIVPPSGIADFLARSRGKVRGVMHMGGISTTTETDVDSVIRSNLRLSIDLWTHCAEEGIPLIYASSASTYGDGRSGFDDRSDADYLSRLRPLAPTPGASTCSIAGWRGRSRRALPLRRAGRGSSSSTSTGRTSIIREASARSRFSCTRRYASTAGSACFARTSPNIPTAANCVTSFGSAMRQRGAVGARASVGDSGIYNVGSGSARSFLDLAKILFGELRVEPSIEYIDLPDNLQDKYQYYTCASMDKLRGAGFAEPTAMLEEGVRRYVRDVLETDDPFR